MPTMIIALAFALLALLATVLPASIVAVIRSYRAVRGDLAPIIGRTPALEEP